MRDTSRQNVGRTLARRARLHRFIVAGVGLAPLLLTTAAHADVLDRVRTFQIQPEVLREALLDFGRQAHVQMILRDFPRTDLRSVGITGRYTARQAVVHLLRGTDLTYSLTDHTVAIFPRPSAGERPAVPADETVPESTSQAPVRGRRTHANATRHKPAVPSLRQVIVTGTHLSGGPPPSEPILTITQGQIRESGYQSVEQLMASLPENFNDVGSEQNGLQSGIDSGNLGYGAAVDLFGLGYDSTLVLVNGHRLAPAGVNGAFTDVSVIPLSAIKRIDIVTDGASAVYGADAIGGVVNYVLRNHQHGGVTSVEYGTVTRGGLKDYRASQSYGLNWKSGHALMSYEYHDETPLNVLDRPFSVASAPGDLTPGLTQNSLYLTGGESLSDNWMLSADGFYSHRRDTLVSANGIQAFYAHADSTQYSYAIGTSVLLPHAWVMHAHLSYGGNNTRLRTVYGSLSGYNRLSTASLDANGSVYRLPAGNIKLAAGVQVRYESLSSLFTGLYIVGNINKHRTVNSAFLETEVPLIRSTISGSTAPALVLDLAGRVDHYSDFGTSTNPRLGLAWRPIRGVKIRGTVSSSFKAPNFYQLYGDQYSELVNSPEQQLPAGSSVAVLYLFGSNPNLTAEKSTEWTAGIDFAPPEIPGLSAHVTYYHIRFKQRITDLGIPLLAALDQGNEYAAFIQQNPTAAQLEYWASPVFSYTNLTTQPGLGPSRHLLDAVAIADDRFQNVGQTRSSGMMATASYARGVGAYRYDVGINAAYIFDFKNINVPGSSPYSILNTLGNPVNFRARVTAGIQRGPWTLTGFLNYVNNYRDITTGLPVSVASWTTVNVTGSYRVFSGRGGWGRTRVYLSCINCFDRAPPAVRLISDYLGYDPANANALGRFVTATVAVRW